MLYRAMFKRSVTVRELLSLPGWTPVFYAMPMSLSSCRWRLGVGGTMSQPQMLPC